MLGVGLLSVPTMGTFCQWGEAGMQESMDGGTEVMRALISLAPTWGTPCPSHSQCTFGGPLGGSMNTLLWDVCPGKHTYMISALEKHNLT